MSDILPTGLLFRFAQPEWLWLLLLIPLLALWQGRRGSVAAVKFPAVGLAKQVAAFVRSRPGRWVNAMRWLILLCLIFALARPQTGTETSSIKSSGVDIMMTVDLSNSMWAHDFEVDGQPTDRLTTVKRVMDTFIERRGSDRIGLIAFASDPYLVSPLTLNHAWLRERLRALRLGDIDGRGTAVGSSLGTAVTRLSDLEGESRLVILLTDGANNTGAIEPLAAADAAAAYGIRVYTIGVGREGMVPVPADYDRQGNPARDRRGRIQLQQTRSDIDLETLQEIAQATGGRYYHATDIRQLEQIYAEIDELEKRDVEFSIRRLYADHFWWPLGLGLGLFLLETLLAQTRYRRLP